MWTQSSGARKRGRTSTPVKVQEPESCASANSAILAKGRELLVSRLCVKDLEDSLDLFANELSF